MVKLKLLTCTRGYTKSGCKGTNISRIDQVFSLFFDVLCCFSGVYCINGWMYDPNKLHTNSLFRPLKYMFTPRLFT